MDDLSAQAKANPRLLQTFDLLTTPEDKFQRFLNGVELGTILPIHRHRGTFEKQLYAFVVKSYSTITMRMETRQPLMSMRPNPLN